MRCPGNHEVIGGVCYKKCPKGYKRSKTDANICIQEGNCPVGTYLNTNGDACVKTWTPAVSGSCSQGYQQWVIGQCYPNCILPFLEGGEKCYFDEVDSAEYTIFGEIKETSVKYWPYWVMIGILAGIIVVLLLTGGLIWRR